MAAQSKSRILIADDDPVSRSLISRILAQKGYETSLASDGDEAVKKMTADTEIAILDLRMPKMSGSSCLKSIRVDYPLTEVIIISSAGIEDAVSSMRDGAFWYLQKPIQHAELLDVRSVRLRKAITNTICDTDACCRAEKLRASDTTARIQKTWAVVDCDFEQRPATLEIDT